MSSSTIKLCALTELPEEDARSFTMQGVALVALRHRRNVYVYLNRCPHLGTPLQWQHDRFLDDDRSFIRCSSHGALFEKDSGLCIQGPCHGDSLWKIECRIVNGDIVIDSDELPGG